MSRELEAKKRQAIEALHASMKDMGAGRRHAARVAGCVHLVIVASWIGLGCWCASLSHRVAELEAAIAPIATVNR